jgi:plastocyanin
MESCTLKTGLGHQAYSPARDAPRHEQASDNVKIEIIRDKGSLVFAPVDVAIAAGQSVEWFSKGPNVPHHLVGDPPFKDTVRFTPPATATQKFDTPGVMNYHCTIHPSMKGTITVK